MSIDNISEQIKQFITDNITSVEDLEVLLLLHANPEKEWREDEVSKQLYTTPKAARQRLSGWVSRNFATESNAGNPTFRFASLKPESAAVVAELAQCYKERRVSIITLIYSKPSDTIRDFSDAFRIKKKEN